MTVETRVRTWSRWAGSLSDIEDAARTAEEVLKKLGGAAPSVRVVVSLPGRVAETDSLDEAFGGLLDTRDLSLITSLKIDVGQAQARRVAIHCESKSPAAALEAVAEDRTEVEGLMGRLEPILDRGRQPMSETAVNVALTGALLASVFAIGVVGMNLGLVRGESVAEPGGKVSPPFVLPWVALPLLVLFVGFKMFPALQLLGPGGQPILSRFRTWVLLFVLGVVGSVVATWLYATFFV